MLCYGLASENLIDKFHNFLVKTFGSSLSCTSAYCIPSGVSQEGSMQLKSCSYFAFLFLYLLQNHLSKDGL